MRLAVDTGAGAAAPRLLDNAGAALADAVAALASELDGCGAMSGTDEGGRDWARSYDEVAGPLLRACAMLGGSAGRVGQVLDAGLVGYEQAEAAAYGAPGAGPGLSFPSAGAGGELVTPAALPPAFGGTRDEPEGWHWLAGRIEGLVWPDADTSSMRSAGSAWLRAAAGLESASGSVAAAADVLEVLGTPESPVAAGATRELGRHGEELAGVCRDVGRACTSYAEQVDAHHAELAGICRELLAWTAADQVTGAVLGFVSAGGAEVAAQAVEAGVLGRFAARALVVLRRLVELARLAAALIGRGLARVLEILARLRCYLSLRAVRALERVGSTVAGRRALDRLPVEVRQQVDDAVERAARGRIRFPRQDGKTFRNLDPSYRLPPGDYRSWTVASSGARRGPYRVLIEGDPARPDAVYLWDHVRPPVRIDP